MAMMSPVPATSAPRRIAALDAVRGIAILGVVSTHCLSAVVALTGSSAFPPSIFWAAVYGQFGVQLFFVLSGWLLFSLYTGNRPFSQKAYWARRIARIWPLWAIFVVVSFAFYEVPDTSLPVWFAMTLCLAFLGWTAAPLLQVPQGGLTIQQEMGHYLLFSVFRRRSVAFLAGTVIVGYVSAAAAHAALLVVPPDSVWSWLPDAWLRLRLFSSWPFFLLGGAGCALLRRWRRVGIDGLVPERSWSAVLVVIALVLSIFTTYAEDTPGYFVLGFVLMCAAIAVVSSGLPVIGPVLRSLGRYSYFMYFFHFWVIAWIEDLYRRAGLASGGTTSSPYNTALLLVLTVVVTAASWAAGWVSWNALEKRVLAYAHRKVPEPPRSTPPAAVA